MSLILDILFPKKCVGCKAYGSYLCQDCRFKLMQRDLICPQCERPAMGGQTHPGCLEKYDLDGLWSLGAYQGPLKSAIKSLKYKFINQLADILVDITMEYWGRHDALFLEKIKSNNWVVTAVPLYWYRENKRGFNQASLIGKLFAKRLGLEYIETLKRIRFTTSQVELEASQRKENIKNAFEITKPYTLNPIPCVLLIDDVWTTGSTLRECCKVLKKAGAKEVWALTLAR